MKSQRQARGVKSGREDTRTCKYGSSHLVVRYPVLYAGGVSRLRRPFLSDRFFFVTVRLLKGRSELSDADSRCLALAFKRTRQNRNTAAVSGLIG